MQLLYYYVFTYPTSTGELGKWHVLAKDDADAEILASTFLADAGLDPDEHGPLTVVCPVDLQALMQAGLFNLRDLTLPEAIRILQDMKQATDKLATEVAKSVRDAVARERKAKNAIPLNQYDHIDDEQCTPVGSAVVRRPKRLDRNNILDTALAPLFDW